MDRGFDAYEFLTDIHLYEENEYNNHLDYIDPELNDAFDKKDLERIISKKNLNLFAQYY